MIIAMTITRESIDEDVDEEAMITVMVIVMNTASTVMVTRRPWSWP